LEDIVAGGTPIAPINPDQWLQAVRHALRAGGHRITWPRNRVLQTIVRYQAPFTAEKLYADLQHLQMQQTPGRATVYRTLDQLVHSGWVVRLHTSNSEAGYYATWPGHIHHIVCTSCGKVIAFAGCMIEGMMTHLARQTGFTVEGHTLQVYGRCAQCQALS
jgi:Fur family ferric uptake transcriptional regulator